MKVHSFAHKLILYPVYYIFHHNFLFGYIHKIFFNNFKFKKFKFNLKLTNLPMSHRASFLFKTYEYNDRVLIERNLNEGHKCIVVGGGIGFIATLTYYLTKKKVFVFEINKYIVPVLKKNLKFNKCDFKLFSKNLTINEKKKVKTFYLSKDFLDTTSRQIKKKKITVQNIDYKKIDKKRYFNTLIIDAEGDEEYYIQSLKKLKNIKFIFFELHHNIFKKHQIKNIMNTLKKYKFVERDRCFNSYYFIRSN